MPARIDIPSVYDEVRKAYSGMGYPVFGDGIAKESAESPSINDGSIDDVRAVISSLSADDRSKILARGRTEYKDLPSRLAGRSVAYDGDRPVGFADVWGVYGDGRVRPSPSITVAVSPDARGRGVAGMAVRDAVRKVIERVRAEKGPKSNRLRRFVWRLHNGNDASAAAAAKAGFTEQEFKKPHGYRQFTLDRGEAEKQAADIPAIYDEVRKAYGDMGYPVSGDKLVVSRQPTYVNGKPVPADVMAPEVSGGNTQNDGTVRINPDYSAVMRHWGVRGSGRDFLRTIIGHELGHHVDRTVLRTRARSAERRRLLGEIARSGFHTVYTDSYGPGTDRRKLDKELLAEYLARQVSDRLTKSAKFKPPTSLETVKRLIEDLQKNGLKKVRFSDLFAGRPKFSLFRGANALPAHAHATPAVGDFIRNVVNGVRYEHFTPYPDMAHSYGKFLTVLDASKYKPLMNGSATLSPDFSAMRDVRYLRGSRPSKASASVNKLIMRNPHQVGEIDEVVRGPGGAVSLQPALHGSARSLNFEVAIPARYADKHSRVYIQPEKYPVLRASLENGGIKPVPESVIQQYDSSGGSYGPVMRSRGGQLSLTNMMVQNPDYYVYDASPIQRLAKIMHRHPEFRDVIEPAISKYLGIGASGMAGL